MYQHDDSLFCEKVPVCEKDWLTAYSSCVNGRTLRSSGYTVQYEALISKAERQNCSRKSSRRSTIARLMSAGSRMAAMKRSHSQCNLPTYMNALNAYAMNGIKSPMATLLQELGCNQSVLELLMARKRRIKCL